MASAPSARRTSGAGGLQLRVELLDNALRFGVARGGPCAARRRRPRSGVGELVLEGTERRLGLFDLALERGDPLLLVLRRLAAVRALQRGHRRLGRLALLGGALPL